MALTESPLDSASPIAIVGMACRFPKAPDLRTYWRNLRDGVDAVGPVPESHWNVDDYFDADPKRADHTYAKRGAFLEPTSFYPLEFGISPRDIEATDTTQLFAMLAAREALWDAGYAGPQAKTFDREKTSVMLGVTGSLELVIPLGARLSHPHWRRALEASGVEESVVQEVLSRMSNAYVPWQENSFPGLLGNVAAGRIANRLDLHGTNCVVDAACASSLSALHLACLELQSGRADMALSGGVDTFNDIFMYMCFSKTPALSKSGDARPFSANADGTILGEGVGVLVLKRLDDARRDNDHIYAVIKGLGTSSDGKGNAVYAPSSAGQRRCLLDAYAQSALSPSQVELVEAHGTGTPVGDGIELEALTSVFKEHDSSKQGPWCAVGSVKSMIGHTKAAAGVAGLMKCVLALQSRVLPPTLKAQTPHQKLDQSGPLFLLQSPAPWIRNNPTEPRRAGVSAFGFGGSNFHCLLEQAPESESDSSFVVDSSVGFLAASAADQAKLLEAVERLSACKEPVALRRELAQLRASFDPRAAFRLTHVLDFDRWAQDPKSYLGKLKKAVLDPKGSNASTFVSDGAAQKGVPKLRLHFGDLVAGRATSVFLWSDAAVQAAEACFGDNNRARVQAWWRGDLAGSPDGAAQFVNIVAYGQLLRSLGVNLGGMRKDHRAHPHLRALSDFVRQKIDLAELVEALRSSSIALPEVAKPTRSSSDIGIWLNASGVSVGSPADVDQGPDRLVEAQKAWVLVAAKLAHAGVPVRMNGWDRQAEQGRLALAGKGMAVKIQGANQKPSPCPIPVRPQASVRAVDSAMTPSQPVVQDFVMSKSSIPELPLRHDGSPIQSAQEAFAATQSQIESLVALQEQSARLHQQFLAHQEATLTRYQELIARQQNLVAAQLGLEVPSAAVVSKVQASAPMPLAGPFVHSDTPETRLRAKPAISAAAAAFAGLDTSASRPSVSVPAPAPAAPPLANALQSEAVKERGSAENLGSSELRETLYAIVSDKTGYPKDILEPSMSLDDDLGIDSIKRVEIGSALSEKVQGLSAMDAQGLHELSTLLDWESALVSQLSEGTPPVPTQAQEEIVPKAPQVSPAFAPAQLRRAILEVVSDKTGYPHASLEWEMRLDEDLGIDSIKRVEIFAALQEQAALSELPEADELASFSTLEMVYEGLFDFASQTGGASEARSESLNVDVVSDTPGPDPASSSNCGSYAGMMTLLVEIVADKTGYPKEMIEPTMALDEELGIDSIKRVEIMSALAEQEPAAGDIDAQELAQMRDLESLCQALVAQTGPQNSTAASSVSQQPVAATEQMPAAVPEPGPASTTGKAPARYVARPSPWNPDNAQAPKLSELIPGGACIWMVCAPKEPVGMALEQALLDLGYRVALVTTDQDVREFALPAGLIVVAPPWSLDTSYLSSLMGVLTAFGNARKQAGVRGGVLLGVTQMNGAFGLGEFPVEADPLLGGVVGLVKTAAREWPTMRSLSCDLESGWTDADEIAVALLEQLDLAGPVERGLGRDGTVSQILVKAAPLDGEAAKVSAALPGVEFTEQDLALVSAGARGVTAKATLALAKRGLKHFVLLGRSKAMLQEPDWIVGISGEARMKSMIASKASQKLHPRRLEARYREIMAGREIRAQIDALETQGASAIYVSADLRDPRALKDALGAANIDPVKVSVLVHGAGVLADARIEDKTAEEFASVYGTKVEGLVNLLAWCDTSPLRAIALFSSSTARFGRVGQADYAAANEVLNKIAAREAQVRPHCRVACLNWGPWDGGMVTDGLKAQFASERIFVLDATLAAEHLVEELAHPQTQVESVILGEGSHIETVFERIGEIAEPKDQLLLQVTPSAPEIIMPDQTPAKVTASLESPATTQASAKVSRAEQGQSFLQSLAAQHSPSKSAAPEQRPTAAPRQRNRATLSAAGKAVWKRSVSLKTDPYLSAHAFANRAVLPAAWMVEWMAQAAARLEPSLHLVGVDDFQVLRGVRLTQDEVCDLRVVVGRVDNRGDQRILQMHIASGPDLPGQSTLHGRARVVLADLAQNKLEGLERFPTLRSDDLWDLHQDEIYDLGLFHQDSFRLLGEIRGNRKQPDLVLGSLRDDLKEDRWQGLGRVGEWLVHPEIMDAAFQMMIVWSLKTQGEASLPTSFGRYRQLGQFDPSTVKLAVHVRRRAPRRATADIVWRDLKGRIVATMRDFSCVMDPALREAFRKPEVEPTPPPVDLAPKAVTP